jgi:tetratricopeptide (TPR) repeat protein
MNKRRLLRKYRHFLKIFRVLLYPTTAVAVMILLMTQLRPDESEESPDTGTRLLIADFTGDVGHSDLIAYLKPLLYETLQLSGRLKIYPERKIRRFLKQDSAESRSRTIRSVARQICLEEDIPVALLPGIENLNGSLIISARLLYVNDSKELFVDTLRVNNENHLAATIEELSRRIRLCLEESRESPEMSGSVFSPDTPFRILRLFSQSLSFYDYRSRQDVMDTLEEILKENPDMAVAQLYLGMHYLQIHQRAKALPHIERAKDLSGVLPLKYRSLIHGIHDILLCRYKKANDRFLSYIKAFPSDWQAHFLSAQCETALGNYSLAIEEYRKAIELDDTQIEPYLGLSMALLYSRNPMEARTVLDMASSFAGQNPDTDIVLGLLELVNNNPRFAIQAFEEAGQFPSYRSLGTFLQAQAKIYGGKFEDALEILSDGIVEDLQMLDIAAESAKRLARAQIYITTGDIPAAVAESDKIMGASNDPVFMAQLGSILAATGQMSSAKKMLEQVRALDSDPFIQAIANGLQGEILAAEGRWKESEQSLQLSKKYTNVPSIPLARVFMDSGLWESAAAEFNHIREQKATMLFPFHKPWFMGAWVQALYNAGQCSLESGNSTEAKQYFRQYLWVMENADSGLDSLKEAEIGLTGKPMRRLNQ